MGLVAVGVLALSVGQVGLGERWFSILYRGARIGTAVERIRAVEGDERARRIDRCATRRFLRQGSLVTDEACFRAVVDERDGAVDWFEFESRAGDERHRVEAEWLGNRLVVERKSQGRTGRDEVALSVAPRLASLVRSADHATGAGRGGHAERRGDATTGFVVDDESGAVMSHSDFRVVARRLRAVRHEMVSEAVARVAFPPVEVMNDTAVRTNVRLPENRPVRRLRLRFQGGLATAAIPDDDRQRSVGSGVGRVVEITGSRLLASSVPARRAAESNDETAGIAERWRAGGFSGDLGALVRHVVSGIASPWERARRLSWFVNRALVRKGALHLLGSAEDALRSGSGDCTEHAALLSRLMSLAGIRSRVVLGLVYGDRAFRLHQWVEANTGHRNDDWRPLDPMFDRDDVDATYVKLQSFRAEGAFFEGAASLLDSLSSSHAELIAADFGSGWRSLSRRR